MNLQELTDTELHAKTVETANRQRAITLELLNQLNEVERRRLFSKFNCANLHDYCVSELKMTSGNACHHMNAARLLNSIPAISEKVLGGSIAFTTVAQAESFFKREARSGNEFDLSRKVEVLTQLEGKSTREADKILVSHSSQPEIHFKETIAQKTSSVVEAKLYLDEETMGLLERLKEVWSHAMPHAKFSDIIKRAAQEAVEKNDPLKKAWRAEDRKANLGRADAKVKVSAKSRTRVSASAEPVATDPAAAKSIMATNDSALAGNPVRAQNSAPSNDLGPTPAPTPRSDAGSGSGKTPALGLTKAQVRRAVWARDQSQCTFIDPRSRVRCRAKHFIEEDHVHPKAMGGEYSLENIRLRCRAHNQRHAIDCYGDEKMRAHFH